MAARLVLRAIVATNARSAVISSSARSTAAVGSSWLASRALGASRFDGRRRYSAPAESALSPKVNALADSIVQLNLLEVAELCNVLKKRLNLADVPMAMPMAAAPAGGAPAAAGAAAPAAEEAAQEKSMFDIKLESFDAAAKIKVIREVKNITGLPLGEAKAFVEGGPKVIKAGVPAEEAKKIKATLEEAGAKITLE
eukprot:a679658_10.p1 GENE.a679658_10~~a679658_10.p1  ORF type:complete len:215 (-),score=79.47 a679658_10:14-604(-)